MTPLPVGANELRPPLVGCFRRADRSGGPDNSFVRRMVADHAWTGIVLVKIGSNEAPTRRMDRP